MIEATSRFRSVLKKPYISVLAGMLLFGVLSVELLEADFFEVFYDFTRANEDWELDEWATIGLAAIISMAFVSAWQWRRSSRDAVRAAEELKEQLSTAHRLREKLVSSEAERRARSILLATMSHELRTPLNSIIGFSELLEATASERLTEKERDYLATVRLGGDILLQTVNQILEMARLEAGKTTFHLELLSLKDQIDRALGVLSIQAVKKGLDLTIEPFADVTVAVDPAQFASVLFNVIGNAIKYTATGSVSIRIQSDDTEIHILVDDTGPGMNDEQLANALELFGRGSENVYTRNTEGTGLGLPIAMKVLAAHGGRLELDSTPGDGTCARIILPVPASIQTQHRAPA